MNIVTRAVNILTNPRVEWPRVAAEPATTGGLLGGYALPLALLPLLGTILSALLAVPALAYLGGSLWTWVIVSGILSVVLGLAVMFAMSLIADALAPNFGGVRNPVGALKLLVYSGTAVWVAGFLSFVPVIGFLIWLLGFAYAAYLIYLGSISVMRIPATSAAVYTAVVVVIWIVLSILVSLLIGLIVAVAVLGSAVASGAGYLLR
jgi:hypothetical protein